MFDDLIRERDKKEEKAREIKRKYEEMVKTKEDENK
jgi:hypothetical protein